MAGITIWYDRDGDMLEVIFEDVPATMEEQAEDVFEQRTPDGQIVGFAVLNFSKHDRDKISLPLVVIVTEQ